MTDSSWGSGPSRLGFALYFLGWSLFPWSVLLALALVYPGEITVRHLRHPIARYGLRVFLWLLIALIYSLPAAVNMPLGAVVCGVLAGSVSGIFYAWLVGAFPSRRIA